MFDGVWIRRLAGAALVSLVALSLGCPPAAGPVPADGQAVRGDAASLDIVPLPRTISQTPGSSFVLDATSRISFTADPEGLAEKQARRLAADLGSATGWRLQVESAPSADHSVHFEVVADASAQPGSEAYRIEVRDRHILLQSSAGRGLFYAGQTLRQMISPQLAARVAPAGFAGTHFPFDSLVIDDAPRFRWRGMHLDVGRYLFEVEDIKRLLDAMAFYKLNVFHWHLTEDQGWRIEIEKYPRLTEIGAYRKSTPVLGARSEDDGVAYGGFYTQNQIREVVRYAADLYIDVMPEIELPGHSTAAIAAYPQLGNSEFVRGLEVGHRWGVHPNTLSPRPETIAFYEDVFDEVLELFPFEFIHIGGDEAPKTQWRDSPSAQARMAELGLDNEAQLQAWFVAHFERYLAARGRRLVGWDEIQEGGLPAGATMMVWRGREHAIEAAKRGHDVIMAEKTHTYLDYYQAAAADEPEAIGGFLPLETVYAYEPVPAGLSAEEALHVLGAQGQLWTEYMHEWDKVEYMAFPRLLALAEVVWSSETSRDWPDFVSRLSQQLKHLEARDIGYRHPRELLP